MWTRVAGMRSKLEAIADSGDMSWVQTLVHMQDKALKVYANRQDLTPLEEADREEELESWLDGHGIGGAWELAPIFAAAGTTTELLDRIAAMKQEKSLEGALRWLAYTLETEQLLDEITDSVTRISTLVNSAKQYSNMDRSPYERADIHIGLESTLAMLGSKLEGVTVVKDYDRTLPPVPLYVGEMNQVWTNMIDNAVQAMDGAGTLTITTAREDDCVRVQIEDTGPGIPEELQQRIFEPFFTTKPIGQGTGLGLDISYRIVVRRHGGDIRVESRPGRTCFIVRLPLTERDRSAD
jgi:signal transduction histidine kinase